VLNADRPLKLTPMDNQVSDWPRLDLPHCVLAFDKSGWLTDLDQKLRCPPRPDCPKLQPLAFAEDYDLSGDHELYLCTPVTSLRSRPAQLIAYSIESYFTPRDMCYTVNGSSSQTCITIWSSGHDSSHSLSSHGLSSNGALLCDVSTSKCAMTSDECLNTLTRTTYLSSGQQRTVPEGWMMTDTNTDVTINYG